jgi:SpoVK/Ycf46/Vps4 family AAA+-type ATPase
VLPDDITATLHELIARVQLRSLVLDGWGLERVATTGRGVTALLQGGPGTGKTMVAGVIAKALGFDLYRVDLSQIASKWLGETEKNLAAVFDAAEEGECVLLFDEADSLFGKRTEVKSSNDRYANLEVNYLLQRLDSFSGIAILTTNFGASIDPAFRRRLSLHLQFPLPDEDLRERLWRVHLPSTAPVAGDLGLAALAAEFQLSGGNIRNAAVRAAYLAAASGTPITAAHLRRAVDLEYRDRGKLAPGGALE